MERARVVFFAVVALVIVAALAAWIGTLQHRIDDLTAQVESLSARLDSPEKRVYSGGGGSFGPGRKFEARPAVPTVTPPAKPKK